MTNVLQKSAIASVSVVLVKTLISGITIAIAGKTFTFHPMDPGTIAAILTPTLGAFVTSLHDRFQDADGDGVPDKPKDKA